MWRIVSALFVYLVFCLLGIVLAISLNSGITAVLIPDECYYHNHDMPLLMSLFYAMTPQNGYHPEQNWFNIILTIILGIGLGIIAGRMLVRSLLTASKTN